jgi:hypothetical protein
MLFLKTKNPVGRKNANWAVPVLAVFMAPAIRVQIGAAGLLPTCEDDTEQCLKSQLGEAC